MAEGINDFLNRFFLASGTFRLDVSVTEMSEKRHSEDGQEHIVFVWPSFSVQHYILDMCFCSLPINLLAVLTTRASFILFLALTLPYHVIMLKDRMLSIKTL